MNMQIGILLAQARWDGDSGLVTVALSGKQQNGARAMLSGKQTDNSYMALYGKIIS